LRCKPARKAPKSTERVRLTTNELGSNCPFRNRQVGGSSPPFGSRISATPSNPEIISAHTKHESHA
jgi:hypothetical protein